MATDILTQVETLATNDSPTNDWATGFDAYMNGVPQEELVTPKQKEGWLAALRAQADADTDAYIEDQKDRDFWRRGQW